MTIFVPPWVLEHIVSRRRKCSARAQRWLADYDEAHGGFAASMDPEVLAAWPSASTFAQITGGATA